METNYDTFTLDVPDGQELAVEVLTGRPGFLPYFVSFGRDLTANTSFLLYLNNMLPVDVPATMKMGFDNFLPWYHQLKEGDVIRAGFRNFSGGDLTLSLTIQYIFP